MRLGSLVLVFLLSIGGIGSVAQAKKHNGDFGNEPKKTVVVQKPIEKKSETENQNATQKPPAVVADSKNNKSGFVPPADLIHDIVHNENGEQNSVSGDDSEFVQAVKGKRDLNFIQGKGVFVAQILPDDTDGLRHQRWYVKLSNGEMMFAVYNIDMTERVPLEVNQEMGLGGEFKMTNQGPLIHWLHQDPKERRPDGYVEVNGKRYGLIK